MVHAWLHCFSADMVQLMHSKVCLVMVCLQLLAVFAIGRNQACPTHSEVAAQLSDV